jgi:16S rRNA (guanine966-N2)-methyltransferase
MRVAAGSAKGTELRAPPGRRVRPTTSLTRQGLFSMLKSADCGCDSVLDLFAGSGALGIEALSRGASRAVFVDKHRASCDAVRFNLERTGFKDRSQVLCMGASRALDVLQGAYDTVFLDPPYDDPVGAQVLAALADGELLEPDAIVAILHGDRYPLEASYGRLSLTKTRRYGDSHVFIYRREEH